MSPENYASRTSRLVGQVIDFLIGATVVILSAVLSLGLLGWVGALWAAFYYFFADGMNDGRSYAKKWLGMRVIDESTRRPCTYGQSLVRNLFLYVLGPIDWIFIFGERRRRLGDIVAGTIVVNE